MASRNVAVGVRIGEAEVPPDGPHAAHAQIPDPALHRRERGPALADDLRALDLSVRERRAHLEDTVGHLEPPQLCDPLHIHQMGVVGEPQLHHEQQLGTARVDDRVVAELLQQPARLLD